jgi:predicted Zn-dependent protease
VAFLPGKLGEQIAAAGVTMVGGLGSKPFDGEGLATNHNGGR